MASDKMTLMSLLLYCWFGMQGFCIPGVWSLEVRAQRSTTVSFMDAKTDLSLMYDSLEWDEAFMILGLRNHQLKNMVGQVSVAHF